MSKFVVKDNALIEASHRLGEVEQRLVLLAILKARNIGDTIEQLKDKMLTIHADDYIANFGGTRQGAYKSLKNAVMGLYRAEWGYKYLTDKGEQRIRYERFTQSADYGEGDGMVKFMFSNSIIPMLVELEKRFTIYEIEQVAKLSSSYAMRLYEFFMQHLDKKTGKGWLDISLDDLRFRFGLLPNEYALMSNFKKFVLDFSIKQINEKTDLTANYEQKKQGRTIVGFRFEFKRTPETLKLKAKKKEKEPDLFDGLSDIERQTLQERIDEHIKRIESKGEMVSDFHRQNITKKAIAERWGLDVLAKKQAKAKAAEERKAKQLAIQQAEQEREARERQASEMRRNTMIELFESLEPEQQEFILDEIQSKVGASLINMFKKYRANHTAHKTPMFSKYFYELFE